MVLNLFDPPPYQPHSDTSREAALSIPSEVTAQQEKMVIAALNILGQATDEMIFNYLREVGAITMTVKDSSIRRARVMLTNAEMVRDSGKRVKTKSGRTAAKWEIKRHG